MIVWDTVKSYRITILSVFREMFNVAQSPRDSDIKVGRRSRGVVFTVRIHEVRLIFIYINAIIICMQLNARSDIQRVPPYFTHAITFFSNQFFFVILNVMHDFEHLQK